MVNFEDCSLQRKVSAIALTGFILIKYLDLQVEAGRGHSAQTPRFFSF
jgi:hypothetical protein